MASLKYSHSHIYHADRNLRDAISRRSNINIDFQLVVKEQVVCCWRKFFIRCITLRVRGYDPVWPLIFVYYVTVFIHCGNL
jgi:hypothetical protein